MELAEANGPGAANRTRSSLSGYFAWLLRAGFIDINPIAFTDKAIETGARSRVLADHELKAIWDALLDDDFGAIVKLLILTGGRRDEVGSLRWSEIDLEAATATLAAARTKNRREHVIPLSTQALAILEARARRKESAGTDRDLVFGRGLGDRGFQEWSGSKRDLDGTAHLAGEPTAGWVLHDFRRTLSTSLHENFNVQPHVVEIILGHVSGHKAGVAGVYNKAVYLAERGRALTRWGEHVAGLVAGEPAIARVVNLR
jgi:integrase